MKNGQFNLKEQKFLRRFDKAFTKMKLVRAQFSQSANERGLIFKPLNKACELISMVVDADDFAEKLKPCRYANQKKS